MPLPPSLFSSLDKFHLSNLFIVCVCVCASMCMQILWEFQNFRINLMASDTHVNRNIHLCVWVCVYAFHSAPILIEQNVQKKTIGFWFLDVFAASTTL